MSRLNLASVETGLASAFPGDQSLLCVIFFDLCESTFGFSSFFIFRFHFLGLSIPDKRYKIIVFKFNLC